jgi:hypothetical protein
MERIMTTTTGTVRLNGSGFDRADLDGKRLGDVVSGAIDMDQYLSELMAKTKIFSGWNPAKPGQWLINLGAGLKDPGAPISNPLSKDMPMLSVEQLQQVSYALLPGRVETAGCEIYICGRAPGFFSALAKAVCPDAKIIQEMLDASKQPPNNVVLVEIAPQGRERVKLVGAPYPEWVIQTNGTQIQMGAGPDPKQPPILTYWKTQGCSSFDQTKILHVVNLEVHKRRVLVSDGYIKGWVSPIDLVKRIR